MEELDDLPDQLRAEIEHFFSIYKTPEGKEVEIQGWEGRDFAEQLLDDVAVSVAGVEVDPREQLARRRRSGRRSRARARPGSAAAWRPGSRRAG